MAGADLCAVLLILVDPVLDNVSPVLSEEWLLLEPFPNLIGTLGSVAAPTAAHEVVANCQATFVARDDVIEGVSVFTAIGAGALPVLKDLLSEGVLAGALGNKLSAFNRMTDESTL